MLKTTLTICAIAICGSFHLQAIEKGNKDLTPGVLVCNCAENECVKDGDKEGSSSSDLFAVFNEKNENENVVCDERQDKETTNDSLLACKDCK